MNYNEKIFSVGEYIEVVNVALKREEIKLLGEVSSVKKAASGHVYFTLKDGKADASLDCIIWRHAYQQYGIEIEVGMELVVTGHPQIYAPRGSFSFVASTIELHGAGALKKAYDELKKKLAKEGVFDAARKRTLPELPRKIGIITSLKGAVIHDFMNNLGKFGLEVSCVDARVEGQQAVTSLIEAVQLLKKTDIEVLVVIRGGGSLESLQGFNNEALVRELVAFPVPVIAGIGHDQDVPLAALAADYMPSTPTAAAHLINRSWEEAYAKVSQAAHILVRIGQELRRLHTDLDQAQASLLQRASQAILLISERLSFAEQAIRLHDPTRQLKLGYSIVRRASGGVVRSTQGIKRGERLRLQVSDGEISTSVEDIQ
jgi:exodeoxyribonuclease VII large subunit